MDECTFKPKISDTSAATSKKLAATEDKTQVKGYERVVQRYRAAAEEKKKIIEKIEK